MKKFMVFCFVLVLVVSLLGCAPDTSKQSDEDKLKYGAWFDPDADNSEYVVVGGEPFTDTETNEND